MSKLSTDKTFFATFAIPFTSGLSPTTAMVMTLSLVHCHLSLWLALEHGQLHHLNLYCCVFALLDLSLFLLSESFFRMFGKSFNSYQSSCVAINTMFPYIGLYPRKQFLEVGFQMCFPWRVILVVCGFCETAFCITLVRCTR